MGNQAFSDYVGSMNLRAQRITHDKDTVPHVPYESMGYVHIAGEVFENTTHYLSSCIGVSDPRCAEQYKFKETSTADHVLYLNLSMHCDAVSGIFQIDA